MKKTKIVSESYVNSKKFAFGRHYRSLKQGLITTQVEVVLFWHITVSKRAKVSMMMIFVLKSRQFLTLEVSYCRKNY